MVLSLIMIMMAFFSVQAIFYIVGDKGIVRILELHAEVDSVNLGECAFGREKQSLGAGNSGHKKQCGDFGTRGP